MFRSKLAVTVAAVALLAVPAAASAAAPPNDDFANATPLAVGQTISGSNLDATAQADEPTTTNGHVLATGCSDPSDGADCTSSVWYSFSPADSGTYDIETCDLGTDIDSVLAAYTGTSLDTLDEVASDDDGCPGGFGNEGSQIQVTATGGETYYVEVAGYSGDQGSFYVRAYPDASPPSEEPDTLMDRFSSFAAAAADFGDGAASGPRHSASFSFESDEDGATFECALDGAAFSACTSPVSYDLAPGTDHTFAARAVVAGAPDASPAVQRFTVDATPPETSLLSGPTGGDVSDATPAWAVATTEPYLYDPQLNCSLDSATDTGCDSVVNTPDLCNGTHTFTAAAIDRAFNLDPTPLSVTFNETGGSTACTPPTISSPQADDLSATEEEVGASIDGGAGARITADYGLTSAYGSTASGPAAPGATSGAVELFGLAPSTTYHYRVTITSPYGSASTDDATFTTDVAATTLPSVSAGTAVIVGHHAAAVPVTIGPRAGDTGYGVVIDGQPATAESPQIDVQDVLFGSSDSETHAVDITDLDPGAYHVRPFVSHSDGPITTEALGDEITFTVPPVSVSVPPVTPPAPAPVSPGTLKHHFKLVSSDVSVAKVKHSSKTIAITVRHLPVNTKVTVRLTIGRRHVTITRTTKRGGTLKIKLRLSKKARSALHSRKLKRLTVKVTSKPSGDTATSVSKHATVRTH